MNRDCCAYAAYYCEENVYHLACRIEPAEIPGCAVFVSNLRRTCAMTAQRRGGAVVWDYHVIYVADIDGPMVYDLDTILPFPVDLDRYLAESFPPSAPPPYRPMFRAVATPTFLREFASDRRHMRRPDGSYYAPPPSWAPIHGERGSTLGRFIDIGGVGPGVVADRSTLSAAVARCFAESRAGVGPTQSANQPEDC